MDTYTIYCNSEQTKDALKLGAPIQYASIKDIAFERYVYIDDKCYAFPTTEQMIEWLIKEYCILPVIDMANSVSFEYGFASMIKMENNIKQFVGVYPSRKEATLAAIDAALNYFETHNN